MSCLIRVAMIVVTACLMVNGALAKESAGVLIPTGIFATGPFHVIDVSESSRLEYQAYSERGTMYAGASGAGDPAVTLVANIIAAMMIDPIMDASAQSELREKTQPLREKLPNDDARLIYFKQLQHELAKIQNSPQGLSWHQGEAALDESGFPVLKTELHLVMDQTMNRVNATVLMRWFEKKGQSSPSLEKVASFISDELPNNGKPAQTLENRIQQLIADDGCIVNERIQQALNGVAGVAAFVISGEAEQGQSAGQRVIATTRGSAKVRGTAAYRSGSLLFVRDDDGRIFGFNAKKLYYTETKERLKFPKVSGLDEQTCQKVA